MDFATPSPSVSRAALPIMLTNARLLPLPESAPARALPAVRLEPDPIAANTHGLSRHPHALRRHAPAWLGHARKDIRYLCEVPEYFLSKVAGELTADGWHGHNHARRGSRGGAPGIWSICETRRARLEAARFVTDWVVADVAFDRKPDPIAFEEVYRRYRDWGWSFERRDWLAPSACLAIVRNIRSGELLLNHCLMCRRRSIQARVQQRIGRGGGRCSFCDSPHKVACLFSPDHRVVNPA